MTTLTTPIRDGRKEESRGAEYMTSSEKSADPISVAIIAFRAAIGICKANDYDWRKVGEVVERGIDDELFKDHLQHATEMVAKWPKWKRELLGRM